MWHAHDGMGWWMLFGSVFWLLFLGAIVWLLLGIFSPESRSVGVERPGTGSGDEDPREIARRRYARGEIGRDEFQQMMSDFDSCSRADPVEK